MTIHDISFTGLVTVKFDEEIQPPVMTDGKLNGFSLSDIFNVSVEAADGPTSV